MYFCVLAFFIYYANLYANKEVAALQFSNSILGWTLPNIVQTVTDGV